MDGAVNKNSIYVGENTGFCCGYAVFGNVNTIEAESVCPM
jgi:hypothetical protein